jgi:hypothetical protein
MAGTVRDCLAPVQQVSANRSARRPGAPGPAPISNPVRLGNRKVLSGGRCRDCLRLNIEECWLPSTSTLESKLLTDPGVNAQSRDATPRLFSLNPKFLQRVTISGLSSQRVSWSKVETFLATPHWYGSCVRDPKLSDCLFFGSAPGYEDGWAPLGNPTVRVGLGKLAQRSSNKNAVSSGGIAPTHLAPCPRRDARAVVPPRAGNDKQVAIVDRRKVLLRERHFILPLVMADRKA